MGREFEIEMTQANHSLSLGRLWVVRCSLFLVLLFGAPFTRAAETNRLSDDAFLDLLERKAFDYFWLEANPKNGLIKDRSTPNSKSSIAAVGFGLSGINIAVERGWIAREAGRERVLTTLRTFAELPQGDSPDGTIGTRGWFYHFLEMETGHRAWKCELSSIDTALLLGGVLDAEMFFDADQPDERRIREIAQLLVRRIDWNWMCNAGDTFTMGWHPEKGFIQSRWVGYNEAMLLYVLGLGAMEQARLQAAAAGGSLDDGKPGTTSPVLPQQNLKPAVNAATEPKFTWDAWTRGYKWAKHGDQQFVEFPPLFGHQYSHCWIDFRGIADAYMRDKGLTYFENSRRATLAQRAYCVAQSARFSNYGPLEWGITACDGPRGYGARGAPPAENDDGTLAPTAVGGSLPFAPEVCLPTLRELHARHAPKLWGAYGFRDSFNVTENWWATDTLGIDQGPILLMAENYRTGAVWRRLMRHPVIQSGLKRAGFTRVNFP